LRRRHRRRGSGSSSRSSSFSRSARPVAGPGDLHLHVPGIGPLRDALVHPRMTGTADVPSTSRTAAAPVEESVAAPASGPGPLLSPSSDSADTTEPALEEPSAPTSPPPAEPVEPAPVGQVAEPPEAWAEMLAFLDRMSIRILFGAAAAAGPEGGSAGPVPAAAGPVDRVDSSAPAPQAAPSPLMVPDDGDDSLWYDTLPFVVDVEQDGPEEAVTGFVTGSLFCLLATRFFVFDLTNPEIFFLTELLASSCVLDQQTSHAEAVADTLAAWPTIPSGTWTSRLLLWPPWLRGLLLKYWRLFSQDPPPAAFGLVAAHSLKCTLLSWARQLHIDSDLRRIQGHRRQSGSDRSVSLYSRDDILPVLRLQRIVVEAIRAGFLPLQPMAVSFVFLTAANSFSGTTLHVLNSATYVHGCPRTPLSKASFLHGSYWPSARFCSCCINFWAKATCRCIVSSAATTLLLSPPAGKDFPWPPAPVQLGFKPDEEFSVDWSVFQESPQLTLFPSPADFLGFIAPVADLPS
ncbi:unnamed protein product, partial [Symbiodinium microadriaticum]